MTRARWIAGLALLVALGGALWGLGEWVWVGESQPVGLEEGTRGLQARADTGETTGVSSEGEVGAWAQAGRVQERGTASGELRVRCLTKDKQPIPGAVVKLRIFDRYWGTPWVAKGREPSVEQSTLVDAQGEAVFHLSAMATHSILFVGASSETHAIRNRHRVLRVAKAPEGTIVLEGVLRDFRIDGLVLDEEGHALEGADIGYWTIGGTGKERTDAEGRFSLRVPRVGSLPLSASAIGRVRRSQRIPIPDQKDAASCVFRLGKAKTVVGRVLDAKERAVDDALVVILTKSTEESAHTDPDGRFSVGHLDPTQSLRSLRIEHPGFLITKAKLDATRGADLGVFRLKRGLSLSGRVLDPMGKPVQGALVFLTHSLDRLDRITDEQGRFAYDGIPTGGVALLAKATGFGAGTLRLQATTQEGHLGDFNLQLTENHSIGGRIRDGEDHPLAGIAVSAYRLGDAWGIQLDKSTVTDDQGRYSLEGLPLEKLQVYVHGATQWRDRSRESRVDQQHLDFVLEPILALRLRVLDGKTKKPVPHLQVTAWIPEKSATRIPPWWLKDPDHPGRRGWSRPHAPKSGEVLVHISELDEAQRLNLVLQAEGYQDRTVQSLRASPRPELQTILLKK